jgi:murein DD-endopeptidase MepM/ murein hydrolase activator NlpD
MGDVLVATEDGVVVGVQGWAGENAKALLFETDSGLVVLYGAVLPGSTAHRGARISEGKPLAKVGVYPGGSSMLHMELYRPGTRTNAVWDTGTSQPEELLDPTPYLEAIIEGYRYVPPGQGGRSKLGPLVMAAASAGALWGLLGKR